MNAGVGSGVYFCLLPVVAAKINQELHQRRDTELEKSRRRLGRGRACVTEGSTCSAAWRHARIEMLQASS